MKIKLGVLFGGRSAEHEISVISAMQAIKAADASRYDIIPIYIAKTGVWYTGAPLLDVENYRNTDKLLHICQKIVLSPNANDFTMYKYPQKSFFGSDPILNTIDVILPVIHGSHGEDGMLQGFLDLMNIPYAGCNHLASAVGMDKIVMKMVFQSLGLPVVDWTYFYTYAWIADADGEMDKVEAKIGFPVIVKPADLGSSIGIRVAKNRTELREAIDNAVQFSRKIIIEKAVSQLKEINCSVLGDSEHAQPSVCEEPISAADGFLSYEQKYQSGGNGSKGDAGDSSKGMASVKRKIPADISAETMETIQNMSVKAFQGMDAAGVSRIDYLIDLANNAVYINEINTIPGSLSFYLWEATGVSFNVLIDRLVELALKKHREKNNLAFTFDANIFAAGGSGKK